MRQSMKYSWNQVTILPFFFLLIVSSNGFSQNARQVGLNSIKSKDLLQTVGYLSSQRFEGRLPGSAQYDQAARYVATRLKNAGVKPVGQKSMLHYFDQEVNEILDAQCFLLDENNNYAIKPLTLGKDYVCRGFTGSGNVKAETVFVGFGIDTDEYSDYRGINVKGKIVLVYKSLPPWKPSSGSWGEIMPRDKARFAQKNGAVGIVFIPYPGSFPKSNIYGSIAAGKGPQLENFPMIQVSNEVSDSLFGKLPFNADVLYGKIVHDKAPHSIETGRGMYINIKTDYFPSRKTANVIGVIEGSDPKRKNQFIVLGAHLDHVGQQAGKIYFPGANDNASGVATLIAIAEAIKNGQVKTKRSIIFAIFSSEETGLNGSKYFVENSPINLKQVTAMLNFDCVADGDSIAINGHPTFPRLWRIAKRMDKRNTKLLSKRSYGGGGADAEAFYQKGISTLYFNATNGYKHLHQTTDKVETLNPVLIEKEAKLGYLVTLKLANGWFKGEKARKRE
ncbi:MAG: M20/M25/M40 family metallo-hydrolase [Bacteroidales bacterium]|nr:M20/M25/M40 family metallo-hydrolase [Bacteroidales bacterium]